MTKRLILAGGGHAHLAVLESWLRKPLAGVETILITPDPVLAYSGMIPGWIAGLYRQAEFEVDVAALARNADVRLIEGYVCGLDANARMITLCDGKQITFDLLSLATGGEANINRLRTLGDRLLPAKPSRDFVARWPACFARLAAMPHPHLVIVGGGAAGVELALCSARALRDQVPDSSVTLVHSSNGLASGHGKGVAARIHKALKACGVKLVQGMAEGHSDCLKLADGRRLDADLVIAATGSRAPAWLGTTGLQLDREGFVEITADLCSISHKYIFAAGDIVSRVDRALPRSGVHAVKAGPILADNLRASLCGGPMREYQPSARSLYLLATGSRHAIMSWGEIAASGRLAWRLKDWIDRRFIAHFAALSGNQGR